MATISLKNNLRAAHEARRPREEMSDALVSSEVNKPAAAGDDAVDAAQPAATGVSEDAAELVGVAAMSGAAPVADTVRPSSRNRSGCNDEEEGVTVVVRPPLTCRSGAGRRVDGFVADIGRELGEIRRGGEQGGGRVCAQRRVANWRAGPRQRSGVQEARLLRDVEMASLQMFYVTALQAALT